MKYAVVYASATGNTAMLAEEIRSYMKNAECVYFGEAKENIPPADIIFAGFWTDKGNCSDEMGNYLAGLREQKIFLFGTAGFGGSKEYFSRILEQVKGHIPDGNTVIGTFMCQGKMPVSVRHRYEELLKDEKMKDAARAMIANFDHALSHPDETDLKQAEAFALRVAAMIDAV